MAETDKLNNEGGFLTKKKMVDIPKAFYLPVDKLIQAAANEGCGCLSISVNTMATFQIDFEEDKISFVDSEGKKIKDGLFIMVEPSEISEEMICDFEYSYGDILEQAFNS